MPAANIRNSFAYQHLVEVLKQAENAKWTPLMVCVYNDYDDDLTEKLIKAYEEDYGISSQNK